MDETNRHISAYIRPAAGHKLHFRMRGLGHISPLYIFANVSRFLHGRAQNLCEANLKAVHLSFDYNKVNSTYVFNDGLILSR